MTVLDGILSRQRRLLLGDIIRPERKPCGNVRPSEAGVSPRRSLDTHVGGGQKTGGGVFPAEERRRLKICLER